MSGSADDPAGAASVGLPRAVEGARAALGAGLARAGFNVLGVVTRDAFDALAAAPFRADSLLPRARSVVVVGAGGRALFAAFEATPRREPGPDPLDAYTERVVADAAAELARAGFDARVVLAHESRGGAFLDMVALGCAAGLGWPSRLGLLLHPGFGPWMSLRAAILTAAAFPPTPALLDPGPCAGCSAPCADACPVAAPRPEGFDVDRCATQRRSEASCDHHCAARRACVVGPGHAYTDRAEQHHLHASARTLGIRR